jgi:putative transposase
MSIVKKCALLGIARSGYYHRGGRGRDAEEEMLMRAIDRIYTGEPTYGSRRMRDELRKLGHKPGRGRVRRLMRGMGIEPIYPKPRLSVRGKGHRIYPYLLRGLKIERSNHVWCADITYIPLGAGHVYLTAVMDWSSRFVIAWKLSNSLDEAFCLECLQEALAAEGTPEIFNTDQGSQFTGKAFTGVLKAGGIRISMDGRGRALDNVVIERFWRTLKYDDVYIRGYERMDELRRGIAAFIEKYNRRNHQGLGMSPEEKYRGGFQQKEEA